jgi:hypothetical protein
VAGPLILRCSPRFPVRSGTRLARPLRLELSAERSLWAGGLVSRSMMGLSGRLRLRRLLYSAAVLHLSSVHEGDGRCPGQVQAA